MAVALMVVSITGLPESLTPGAERGTSSRARQRAARAALQSASEDGYAAGPVLVVVNRTEQPAGEGSDGGGGGGGDGGGGSDGGGGGGGLSNAAVAGAGASNATSGSDAVAAADGRQSEGEPESTEPPAEEAPLVKGSTFNGGAAGEEVRRLVRGI